MRLPIDAGLRAIEDRGIEPTAFRHAFADAAVPFLDLGATGQTYDGSHLDWQAAKSTSSAIGDWMVTTAPSAR